MDVPEKDHQTHLYTWNLIHLVGVCLELVELDPKNKAWYEGYRDAMVSLISGATDQHVNYVRKELADKVQEFRLEDQIEQMFGDTDGLTGFDC